MPVNYRIDKSLGLVFTNGEGVYTLEDVLTFLQKLQEDPDFDPSYNELIDLRNVIEYALSAAEVETISSLHVFNERSRRAIVAEKDLEFGMNRIYESYRDAGPGQIKVFRNIAEARRWLGLD